MTSTWSRCLLLLTLVAGGACARPAAVGLPPAPGGPDAAPSAGAPASAPAPTASIPLIIRNRGVFDVNVYVHRGVSSPGRRVGTVSSGSEGTFRISEADLQAGRQLMLGVRAIAGRSAWVSPAMSVGGGGVIARLDVMSDSNGDLGRTVLYLENK